MTHVRLACVLMRVHAFCEVPHGPKGPFHVTVSLKYSAALLRIQNLPALAPDLKSQHPMMLLSSYNNISIMYGHHPDG